MRLKGKRAIITAGASGMGRAAVERFAQEGATVVAIDIDKAKLHELTESLRLSGVKVSAIHTDLIDPESCRGAIHEAARRIGGIDILWNHAGLPGRRDFENLDLEAYERTMNLNIRTGVLATGAAHPHLLEAGGGSIIFTASVAGIKGGAVSPIYSLAKFGVVGLARSLALRYAKQNIRVNTICPGPIETPMLPQFMDPDADAERATQLEAMVRQAVPMGRIGRPEEVAAAGLWLASDEASFVTGVVLPVDGGLAA